MDSSNKWFTWFTMVAIVNGLIALAWTAPMLLSGEYGLPNYNIAKTVAGGSVGTWGTVGYFVWLIVGVVVIFLCGVAYYIIPKVKGGTVFSNILALLHLVGVEVGTLGASVLLAWAGFVGGTDVLNGKAAQVHPDIVDYVAPIMVFTLIGILGGLVGAFNLIMTLRGRKTVSK